MTDPLFGLEGRAILITGAGGAIGSTVAAELAGRGARVMLQDLSEEKVAPVAEAIVAAGGIAETLVSDLSTADAAGETVRRAHAALGGLDVLVNSAGTNRRKPIDEVTADDFDAIVAVNLRAVFFASQAAHPIMAEAGGGSIVNLSSLSARFSFNTISVYAATKAGVTSLTRSCAREWARDGIRVNCLEPFVIKTEFTKPLWGEDHRQRWFDHVTPVGRLGDPGELVGAVVFLASDASTWMTGQSLVIDGGLTAGADWDAYRDL
ncbi:MAG: SDR family NAD(P)-dependent oxidoreductase [Candidatus Nanopelagicales bacterium]